MKQSCSPSQTWASRFTFEDWEYGAPGEQFPCCVVLAELKSSGAIVYCEDGFGPRNPWGLISLRTDEPKYMSMGMDSGWFPTLMDAFFESWAATDLPIWRVFNTSAWRSRAAEQ